MTKLLKSELIRLFKNKLYILSVIVITGMKLFVPDSAERIYPCENIEYYAIYTCVFVLIFVGTVFRERTVLNLLSLGVTKTQLYFTELIVSSVIAFSFTLPLLLQLAGRKHVSSFVAEKTLTLKEFLSLFASHGTSFSGAVLTVILLGIFVTVLCAWCTVNVVMVLHSDIKASAVLAVIIVLMSYSVFVDYGSDIDRLPYLFDEDTAGELSETDFSNVDIFDASSFEGLPEFSDFDRNPLYIDGAKGRVLRTIRELLIGIHLDRISGIRAEISDGKIYIWGPTTFIDFDSSAEGNTLRISLAANPESPLDVLKVLHMEYCVGAVVILNLFGLALFRKSDLS